VLRLLASRSFSVFVIVVVEDLNGNFYLKNAQSFGITRKLGRAKVFRSKKEAMD